jgi:hypothetical protein
MITHNKVVRNGLRNNDLVDIGFVCHRYPHPRGWEKTVENYKFYYNAEENVFQPAPRYPFNGYECQFRMVELKTKISDIGSGIPLIQKVARCVFKKNNLHWEVVIDREEAAALHGKMYMLGNCLGKCDVIVLNLGSTDPKAVEVEDNDESSSKAGSKTEDEEKASEVQKPRQADRDRSTRTIAYFAHNDKKAKTAMRSADH